MLEERGGLGEPIPVDNGKGENHTSFPLWGWIPPGVVAALGMIGAAFLWRR